MRMRKKPNLPARMERCAHLLVASPQEFRGRWRDAFGYCELLLELGCGKGRFTVETAAAQPDSLFVAVEKSADAMIIALERAVAGRLENVRFLNAYADNVCDFFAPGEVSGIYLNFCDPWPSNRHIKRRLTSRLFLEQYRQVLCPGGDVRLKTDNVQLFAFSLREFELGGFILHDVTRDLHADGPVGVMTDYELKFFSQGTPIFSCRAVME